MNIKRSLFLIIYEDRILVNTLKIKPRILGRFDCENSLECNSQHQITLHPSIIVTNNLENIALV